MITYLSQCFIISKQPFTMTNFENADTLKISLNDANEVSSIEIIYNYTDSLDGTIYDGNITVTYTDVGNITLEGLVG